SLAAAATVPLAMALIFAVTGRPWPEGAVVTSYVIPPLVCAVLAWAPTRVLEQLSAAVQKARRVGNYELRERLGAGGMGEVWLGRHRLLARPAAVKLIKPEMLGAKDQRARELVMRRFEREAQVTASLESQHTVELYDFGVSAEGVLFYVMELLRGVDLDTLVERFGPLPSERVVYFLIQACDSLEEAHARGLIHRDIKPANLFVSRKGSSVDLLKVLDFGLVKRWNRDDDDELVKSLELSAPGTGQTVAGQIVGTPAFLAPEAALGEQAVDQRADIYALGCVGYWMLTGTHVFVEDSVIAIALAHITKAPEPPSKHVQGIAPELEALLMSCLQKDPEKRPRSAEALRSALEAIVLPNPWSRERAHAFWQQHLPAQKLGSSARAAPAC
ncbi:MAG TPA: serine/threonine-protein kinase, partial [Polyangiaceae bacterium]|nr:serine/threonine-protein kinase [Polyangiaceae bacterium]